VIKKEKNKGTGKFI